MGQKVNPIGLRLGITEKWRSRWYAGNKDYPKLLQEDLEVKRYLDGRLSRAGVSQIEIERSPGLLRVDVYTARPGIAIGRRGSEVDVLRADLEKMTGKQVQVNILEVHNPETNAVLIAQSVAEQIEARVSFKRAMKKAVSLALRGGAQGVKISCSGRLGGSEMARTEWYREGRVPLHTLRAKIDYGFTEARTTFGRIGVKVWVYHGEMLSEEKAASLEGRPAEKAVKLGDLVAEPVGEAVEIAKTSPAEQVESDEEKGTELVEAGKPKKAAKKTKKTEIKDAVKIERAAKAKETEKVEKAKKTPEAAESPVEKAEKETLTTKAKTAKEKKIIESAKVEKPGKTIKTETKEVKSKEETKPAKKGKGGE